MRVVILVFVVTALASYFLGSIPSGYLAGRARGVDIRTQGSGNIGATNVFRILGRGLGITVLLADGLKGWCAVALIPGLALRWFPPPAGSLPNLDYLSIVAGIAAVLGHNYTCWLRFKGGKGIATSAGVVAALLPQALLISMAVWIIVCLVSRYVSVASIAAALVLPFGAWYAGRGWAMVSVAALLGGMAIYKHKANMKRLLAGTENRLGRKAPAVKAETKP